MTIDEIHNALNKGQRVEYCGDKIIKCRWGCESGLRVEFRNGSSIDATYKEIKNAKILV